MNTRPPQIGDVASTALSGTKAWLQSTAGDAPGTPMTVTSRELDATSDEEKLTAPEPNVKWVAAGNVAGPPL